MVDFLVGFGVLVAFVLGVIFIPTILAAVFGIGMLVIFCWFIGHCVRSIIRLKDD